MINCIFITAVFSINTNIMEQTEMGSARYCFGCLSNEESAIHDYKLCNSVLKAMLQTDKLFLCYLCKRTCSQAELFIQNVQSNQILLGNLHDLTESKLQSACSRLRLPHQLTCVPLEILELESEALDVEDSITNVSNNATCNLVVVKQEMKEEECIEDSETHEVIAGKRSKKIFKKYKKNKVLRTKIKIEGKDSSNACKIKTVHITRDQCFQERTKLALERRYIMSTYKCEDCVKGFTYKEGYDKHMEKHNPDNGNFECDICKQRMNSELKLMGHKKYHEVRYSCPACGLTCATRLTVKDHYIEVHTDSDYKHCCPHCSKTFKRRLSWRKHISSVHRQKRVTCELCNKTYANNNALRSHKMSRHPSEVSGQIAKPHVCQDCGKAFRAASLLKAHATKHSHIRDYYCVECDKSFKSSTSLKHHLKTASPHVGHSDLPISCEQCDMRFAVKRNLERHINRVHLNIKPFQCDQCEKAYMNAWSLTDHKRLIHEGYKRPLRYPCTMCDKVFQHNKVLKDHIRTHTGERPFQCSICPAQFAQASVLRTHIKLIHLKLTRDGKPKAI